MKMPEKFLALQRLDRPLWALLIALGVLLMVNELVGRFVFDAMNDGLRDRLQAQEAQTELMALLSGLQAAESAQRGYLLAGNPRDLRTYTEASAEARRMMARLSQASTQEPELGRTMQSVVSTAQEKLEELEATQRAASLGTSPSAQQMLESRRGQQLMDALRQTIMGIQMKEAARARTIDEAAARQKISARVLGIVTTGLMLAFLAFACRVAQRNAEERTRLLRESDEAREAAQSALAKERLALQEAERVSRVKDEFLAVVSHELRTPLNAIAGWAAMLRETGEWQEVQEGVDSIERNAQAQARIIEDLLDVSRIIAGKLHLKMGTVDLKETLRAVRELLRPASQARELVVETQFCEESAEVLGDAARLQQVLWNLLSNAIKFTPKGGKVVLSLSREETILRVQVRDTGQGLAADYLPRIFDRFSQADSSTTRRQGGLGLGLALVKNLVELHGGTVRAESAGLGKGTAFILDLPLVAVRALDDQPASAPTPAAPREGRGNALADLRGLRVLVLDDQKETVELMARLLRRCQAEVHPATRVPEALEEIQRWRPDVVISDIGMPDEDGYSFIKKVRALSSQAGGRTPAVALTAFARREDAEHALQCGFQVHLTKPADPARLTQTIQQLSQVGSATMRSEERG